MKLKELKHMGSLERRIYNGLFRLISFGLPYGPKGFYYGNKRSTKELDEEIKNLDLKDVLDMYSEEDLMRVRNFGVKCMDRLKELA